ncbi:MAG: MATE family efflux transporter [Bacteroidaceae bacterium]|nr:MATE family efflux transporter [Bacteroidales bacterium]MCF0185359.1 MATE family efflux transporter [Bacteroidaceae bacterium]
MRNYGYKEILKITWPLLVSLVMEQLIGICDTAFLGRVSEVDLGASAIAGVYYMTLYVIGLSFAFGSQVIIGRRNGEGNLSQIGGVFYQGLYVLLGLGAVVVLVTELFCEQIMGLLISSPDVLSAAVDYVNWRMPGLLFAYCAVMFRSFFLGIGRTKSLTTNSIIMVLSNVFLDWVFIFGKCGLPAMGIKGAAIASSLSVAISFLHFVVYIIGMKDRKAFNLHRPPKFDFKKALAMLKISVWTMIDGLVVMTTWLLFFVMIGHYSEHDLAISNLLRSISGLLWMFTEAFASASTTLVSNMIGEGRSDEVHLLAKRILKLTYLVVGVVLIIPLCFPMTVARVFTDIPQLAADTASLIYIISLCYIVTIPGSILWNVTMGTGNVKTTLALELIALVAYLVYCVLAMRVFVLPLSLCWLADYVYFGCLAIFYYFYLRSNRWRGKAV